MGEIKKTIIDGKNGYYEFGLYVCMADQKRYIM